MIDLTSIKSRILAAKIYKGLSGRDGPAVCLTEAYAQSLVDALETLRAENAELRRKCDRLSDTIRKF